LVDHKNTTFCQSVIVNVGLSCTIFKIFNIEGYRDLEIYVRGHSPCEFMHGLYVTEIYKPGGYFYAADST